MPPNAWGQKRNWWPKFIIKIALGMRGGGASWSRRACNIDVLRPPQWVCSYLKS